MSDVTSAAGAEWIVTILDAIAREHAIPLSFVRQFSGLGLASTICEVAGERGPMVLKYGTNDHWIRRMPLVLETSRILRAHQYPAAEIYESGTLSNGAFFFLQQLLPGDQLASADNRLTTAGVQLLLDIWTRHRRLTPPGRAWWTEYIRGAMFNGEHEGGELAQHPSPAIQALLQRLQERIAPLEYDEWSTDDFVHGDFGPHNVLVEQGAITGVVDIDDSSGRGDYVIDLARTVVRMERSELIDAARPHIAGVERKLAVAGAYWILWSLCFPAREDPDGNLTEAVRATQARLDALFALCGI